MAAVALAANPVAQKLRVGLWSDAEHQPRWLVEAFAKVAASDFAEIVAIAVVPPGEARARASRWPDVYGALDRKFFAAGADPDERLELARYVPHGRKISGGADALLALDLDVVFALGESDDTVLDGIARYGVWRFCVDGLKEVVAGEPLSRSALVARLAPGAEPRLVYQSWARTYALSIARNRAQVLAKTAEFAWRALREAQRYGHPWLEQCKRLRQDARQDDWAPSRLALSPILRRMASRAVEKALYREQWFLAFRYGNGADPIAPDLEGFTRLMPPADRYWADPFVIQRGDRHFVFFEELPASSGKGHIALIEIAPGGRCSAPQRVLERDYHLSYPFLVEDQDALYMIPETAQNRTVELYRCIDFPLRWKLERVLLDGVRLADATVYRAADRWWMFANGAPGASRVFDDELHLFHAARLLGDWQPHARNPVKSDVRCARPAGRLYWRSGALHRPAQICVPLYGAGLSMNRVLRLTPHEYAERQVERVLPAREAGLLGMHTINRAGALTVVDAFTRRARYA